MTEPTYRLLFTQYYCVLDLDFIVKSKKLNINILFKAFKIVYNIYIKFWKFF